jgi:hypothetical protein
MNKSKAFNKQIFLEDLPQNKSIKHILWTDSIYKKVHFIYDGIDDYVEIIDYEKNRKNYLTIKYNDVEFEIHSGAFKKCCLGELLNKYTSDFKIEIGTIFKDGKRDITIIDREIIPDYNKDGKLKQNKKYYKYHCNKCGFSSGEHYSIKDKIYKEELWTEESNLKQGRGCSCCSGRTLVENINSIVATDPWMIPYFQGGYDEAKKYSCNSSQRIFSICPDCLRIKDKSIAIYTIKHKHSIGCSCSDSIPYGEKLMFSILEQLGVDFQTQLSKTTFKWCQNYKYDFLFNLNGENILIEMNGRQHYEDAWDKLEKTQLNDKLKKELALKNGIKKENYIVIDCRKSELEFIKDNILKDNKLNKLFDLSKINWLKVEEFALSNLIKIACEYKRNNPEMTTNDIGMLMTYNYGTIRKWLKCGSKIGWCYYNAEEEQKKNGKENKKVEIFKNNISLGIFESLKDLERQSERLFNVRLHHSNVSAVCLGKKKSHKGFTFKYI